MAHADLARPQPAADDDADAAHLHRDADQLSVWPGALLFRFEHAGRDPAVFPESRDEGIHTRDMSNNDSIETSAASVEEAIKEALEQLGASQDDVAIEVLATPRAGVLGLGARAARVR